MLASRLPTIAIVGRPNVGKSTLFNQFVRRRQALVLDLPGVTRDRQFAEATVKGQKWLLIDTGGIGDADVDPLFSSVLQQTWQGIQEADLVWWVVDAQTGMTLADESILRELRTRVRVPIVLIANKTDGMDTTAQCLDLYRLGMGEPVAISAAHKRGFEDLIAVTQAKLPEVDDAVPAEEIESELELAEQHELEKPIEKKPIKVAIVGKPNVGKSTLVNRLLGEDRVIAFDAPGTTRDSIYIPFHKAGQDYVIIDTAGMRRKARIDAALEKFSVVKTLQAIEDCDVALLLIDAQESLTDQDLGILSFIIETGRGLVLALNKWDGLDKEKRRIVQDMLKTRLQFARFAEAHPISALHGTGVGQLWQLIRQVYEAGQKTLSSSVLTNLLQQAVLAHQPPMVNGRRIKLRYAHAGGHRPPKIVIHGNQTEALPESYRRYLNHYFHQALDFKGTPLELVFKTTKNPYAGKRNPLTPRQRHKRKRLMQHVKKKK